MKCYLYSNESSFIFGEELDSLQDPDIDSIEAFFSDAISDCIFSSALSEKSQGFFPDPWEIETELFRQARICLEHDYGTKIFAKVIDDDGVTISNKAIELGEIIENRRDREQGTIDSGQVIIAMLTNFLEEGIWQYGLQRDDGTILIDICEWPKHASDGRGFVWQDSNGLLEPIIWFGLKNGSQIECWALDKSPKTFEFLEVYENPYVGNTRPVERWHLFWFCSFWTLDWNALFDNNGDAHITWMFAECGMDEPSDEFNAVRDSCPIELAENDTAADVIRKIDRFFVEKQKQTETDHSSCSN